jgi:hypothetical protein
MYKIQQVAVTGSEFIIATGGTITLVVIVKFIHLQVPVLLQFHRFILVRLIMKFLICSSRWRWWRFVEAVVVAVLVDLEKTNSSNCSLHSFTFRRFWTYYQLQQQVIQ